MDQDSETTRSAGFSRRIENVPNSRRTGGVINIDTTAGKATPMIEQDLPAEVGLIQEIDEAVQSRRERRQRVQTARASKKNMQGLSPGVK